MLVTYGAIILCFRLAGRRPWLTTRIERRWLADRARWPFWWPGRRLRLSRPNYATVLALRIAMLAVAAVFTPQAASTVAMIVPAGRRSGAIAFVFLGWSLAIAGGLAVDHIHRSLCRLARRLCMAPALCRAGARALCSGFALACRPARHRRFRCTASASSRATQNFAAAVDHDPADRRVSSRFSSISRRCCMRLTGASHETVGLMFALLWRSRICRQYDRDAHRLEARRLGDFDCISRGAPSPASLLWALGAGLPAGDGRRHRGLGARLCRH